VALEHSIDRLEQSRTPDRSKCGVVFQVLQMFWALPGPCRWIAFPDPDPGKRAPRRLAHLRRFVNAERGAHRHPAMRAKMLERFLVLCEHALR
jgi:hypothetical protein